MKRALLFVVVTLAAAGVWVEIAPAVAVTQPLAFNHAKHTVGLTCVGCHGGVLTGARATLPSGAICARCHASAPPSVTQASWDAIQQAGVPRWVPATRLPEHVLFSHRRHVTVGKLECESCHGGIGTSTSPPTRMPMRLQMKTCLACHQKEGANQDCAGCHR